MSLKSELQKVKHWFWRLQQAKNAAIGTYKGQPMIANIKCYSLDLAKMEGTLYIAGVVTLGYGDNILSISKSKKADVRKVIKED